jgi:hypothetical protein
MELYKQLQTEFNSPQPDSKKCSALLGKLKVRHASLLANLKIALTELSFMDPSEKVDDKTLLMARTSPNATTNVLKAMFWKWAH